VTTPDVPVLETPVLILRPVAETDAPAMHECFADAETMRFWDSLPSPDLAETAIHVRQSVEADPRWLAALIAHCFGLLDTHRIEARIEPGNLPSLALAEALGFAREGLMHDWMCVGGETRSVYLYALLRPEPDRHQGHSPCAPCC
jgi:RimJ/RimL family protein N-acetyltransferase